jgi:predicted MPP superfamily phosphohydrolase
MRDLIFLGYLIIYLASYLYLAFRFNFIFKIDIPVSLFFYALFLVFGIISAWGFIGRRLNTTYIAFLTPLSYIIMGVWAITITFSVLNEIINLAVLPFTIKNFRYYSTLICFIVCVASSAWSLVNASLIMRVKEVSINVPELKTPSLKIACISDIHITEMTNTQDITGLFEKVMSLNADMIVLVGDIIDTDIVKDDAYKQYGFNLLKAKYGVYAVSGNHDYYTGLRSFYELCARNNIIVLQDENIFIEDIINIAGINDSNWKRDKIILDAILSARKDYPVLFLSHRPESFNVVEGLYDYKIIQLSGHTHAGQIPPVEIARRFFMKYNYGLYYGGNAVMYVSSGARWWGPPLRFGNMREIALITLEGNGKP